MKTKTQVSQKNILITTVQITVAALASTVMLGVGNVQANTNILIDDFGQSQKVDSDTNNIAPIKSQVGPYNNILGNYRDMFIDDVTTNDPSNSSSFVVSNGEAFFSNDFGVEGTGIMVWDGDDDPDTVNFQGLGGINIIENGLDHIAMELSSDLPGLNVKFNIYDMNGNISSIDREFSAMPTRSNQDFLFDDLVGDANLNNVGAIELLLTGPARIDASIALIEISKSRGIPEPTSILGLLVIGATGAGSMLKRKYNH